MIKEVIRAQAETLSEWSTQWRRDALVGSVPEGYDEACFLMERLSRLMLRITGDAPPEVEQPPPPVAVAESREG